MKLTAILLLTACLQVSAKTYSQVITLNFQNTPLEKVVKEIEKQTKVNFFYEEGLFQHAKPVTIAVSKGTLEVALEKCFKEQPFDYKIVGKTVFIRKKTIQSKEQVDKESIIDIRGRVINDKGEPVLASVSVKGSTKGTSTDKDGWFVLPAVEDNAILVVSGIGIETSEVKMDGKSQLNIVVRISVKRLDEVQMIAYGATTKRFNTGNVTTVKGSDIEKQPVQNPLLTLQGRVPGLLITQESGVTGGPIKIRLQGQNSMLNGNDPLIVIDGVPFPSQMPNAGAENAILAGSLGGSTGPSPLNFINSSDIESITVLKDADATSIYGSRAANGAILITTKKGKSGESKVEINVQHGIGKVPHMVDVLNRRQYLDMRYEAYRNDGIDWRRPSVSANDLKLWDTTRYTDWQKVLIGGTAHYTNVQANVSGGTSLFQFLVGATYQRNGTVFPGNFLDQRGSTHFNITSFSVNRKFKLDFSGSYMYDFNRLPGIDFTQLSTKMEPVAPDLYNPDGTLNYALNSSGAATWTNPLTYYKYIQYENKTRNLVSNLLLQYSIAKGLELKSSFGYTSLLTNDFSGTPIAAIRPESRSYTPRSSIFGQRDLNTWIVEPQLTYENHLLGGKISVLFGLTEQQTVSDSRAIQASGFSNDQALKNPAAATTLSSGVYYAKYKYNAAFTRLNYNWKDQVVLNLTGRRDGSSRFGDNNKFHTFGSVGVAWIFTQLPSLKSKLSWLSFGKIKTSYGTTGSDQVGDYTYLSLYTYGYSGIPYLGIANLNPTNLYNPDLKWEETKKFQTGVELGFLKDRLLISGTYAINHTSNQLLSAPLPTITGFSSFPGNFDATLENRVLELTASSTNITSKAWSWNTDLNFTVVKNKLLRFNNLENNLLFKYNYKVGLPVSAALTYPFLGVDPNTGQYIYEDSKGSQTTAPVFPSDYTTWVNSKPSIYGGISNEIKYKGFKLGFLIQLVKQMARAYYYNNFTNIIPGRFFAGSSNQPVSVLNRWQQPGDVTDIQKFSTRLSIGMSSSNAIYQDASFIRLKNIDFSYQLPQSVIRKLSLRTCSFYIQCQNVLTITHYKGMDPEIPNNYALPPLRILTAGIKLEL